MEGCNPQWTWPNKIFKTGSHLFRSFVCERHRENIIWGNAVVPDEVGNSMGNHAGFAAART